MNYSQLMDYSLSRSREISTEPLEHGLEFGPRTINDPDNPGETFEVTGYDLSLNGTVLEYIGRVSGPMVNLQKSLEELCLLEELVSTDSLPKLSKPQKYFSYLSLLFQQWLIKQGSCFDCLGRAIAEVFEIGNNRDKLKKNRIDSELADDIARQHFRNIAAILRTTKRQVGARSDQVSTHNDLRNDIVHENKLEHEVLEPVSAETFFAFMGIDYQEAEFQIDLATVCGNTRLYMREVNLELFHEILPLFERLGFAYRQTFYKMLIK